MKTTTTISSTWTAYDTTVAKAQLANYGIIFLDEYDSPIDDIDETDELYEEYSDNVVHDVMTLEYIRNEEARKAVTGTEYDTEAVTDWQSLRDLERDILRKRMTESEARDAFREYFENLIIDMRFYDEQEQPDREESDEEDPESLTNNTREFLSLEFTPAYPDFFIEIWQTYDRHNDITMYEAWLGYTNYGIKELMFGMPTYQQSLGEFTFIALANAEDHICDFIEEYFEENDDVVEIGTEYSDPEGTWEVTEVSHDGVTVKCTASKVASNVGKEFVVSVEEAVHYICGE